LRLSIPVGSRVSFYGVAGVGYGDITYHPGAAVSGGTVKDLTNFHGVFDFGGGIDFRLTRPFSVRGEVRDFVTGSGLGGA
jgi:hypothetical protein